MLMACLAPMLGSPSAQAQSQSDLVVSSTPIQTGTSFELDSAVLGDVRQVNVWLPTGYADSTDRYSVVYLLDGALDQDFHHIAGLAQLGSLSWTFGPIIVIGVQTKNRQNELTPAPQDARYRTAFPESGGSLQFRKFLETEVIPFIEARYRTGERRAVMGESLAGLFVIDTLLRQADLFHDYVAVSPSLWWDDRRPMRTASQSLRSMPPGRRLYLAIANEGGTMLDGVDLLRIALEQQSSETVTVHYSDRSGTATHSTIYHGAAEEAFRWLYPMPQNDYGPTPWFMIDGGSPADADR